MTDEETPQQMHSKGEPMASNYDDLLWSNYVKEANKHDEALVDSWKSDMEGTLIFAGLFSATVTAFFVESYKSLSPDTGQLTVELLTQISQQLAALGNGSNAITAPLTDTTQLQFHPSSSALSVNLFWFFSLMFALVCALAATMIQQGARSYVRDAKQHHAPYDHAGMRAYLYGGVEKYKFIHVIKAIPILMQISLILFGAGFVQFILPINTLIGRIGLACVLAWVAVYVTITIIPLYDPSCPLRTPSSRMLWHIPRAVKNLHRIVRTLWIDARDDRSVFSRQKKITFLRGSFGQEQTRLALENSKERSARDLKAMNWTIEQLKDNAELEPFVVGLAGAIRSTKSEKWIDILKGLLHSGFHLRIVRLLRSCTDSESFHGSAATRVKCAAACVQLIWTAGEKTMDTPFWSSSFGSYDSDFLSTIETFELLIVDKSAEIATYSNCVATMFAYRALEENIKNSNSNPLAFEGTRRWLDVLAAGLDHTSTLQKDVREAVISYKTSLWRTGLTMSISGGGDSRGVELIQNEGRFIFIIASLAFLLEHPQPLQGDLLHLTVNTLQFVTKDIPSESVAVERSLQLLLVRILCQTVPPPGEQVPHPSRPSHIKLEQKLPTDLIDVLLDVVITLDDNDSVERAKVNISHYLNLVPAESRTAKKALQTLATLGRRNA